MLLRANPKSIEIQAKLFRGFSDPSRLSILDALRAGAVTVSEIVEATGLSQSNVSNHLSCLRDCGLVTSEQQGRFVYYELSDKRVGQLLMLADQLLADVAKGVYECTRYNVKESKNG
ncbi:MAG: winged helix-turn-helix transcriptional regulator [Chloroflexi bacterium]|nr:winged helix-turn-helix transcriptional regulator [Chloroflexota bacterium]MBI1854870.1 winged helix-turn-helix transcriptional regulator [Chloroflexota bacterium]MBI3338994.1 winged helix-turn-helix transcriptional regulator [Chloroflexota bacterium]